MLFRLINALVMQQAWVNRLLEEYLDDFVVTYLDDILIFTNRTYEEHAEHMRKVLTKLMKEDMMLKLKKCEFFKNKIEYLGHIISRKGMRMSPNKVKAILDWPTLVIVKEVQAFYGMVNYYQWYINRFSAKARLLTKLFQKS